MLSFVYDGNSQIINNWFSVYVWGPLIRGIYRGLTNTTDIDI
jgi:hypothetical protein